MKTRKFLKRLLAGFMSVMMIMSATAVSLFAVDEAEVPKETVWNKQDKTVEITAGSNGYTFRSVYGPAYEMSNHMVSVNGGINNDIPQTLILVDASKDYTWKPNGKYVHGEANYEILYCCDAETGYNDAKYYKRMNLEDSDYYDDQEARHIRAIVSSSYPYISLEKMKENLKADGFESADELTRAEIITAVQSSIWAFANIDCGEYYYSQTFDVPTNTQWGTVLHDYTNEMDVWWQTGKRVFSKDDKVAKRINDLINYLKALDEVPASIKEIIITSVDILDLVPVEGTNGEIYETTVRVALNNGGSNYDGDVYLDIYVDDENKAHVPVTSFIYDTDSNTFQYDVTVRATRDQKIKAVVSGKQIVPEGAYFYEPIPEDVDPDGPKNPGQPDGIATAREASQCLVGVASGVTNIYAESEVEIVVEETSISGAKIWKDNDNQDGIRPESIIVNLWADYPDDEEGKIKIDSKMVKASDGWSYCFDGLIKKINDELIVYSVTEEFVNEELVDDYESVVDGYDIINSYTPQTTSVTVNKTWADNDNEYGNRPETITINLLADGEEVAEAVVTADELGNWTYTFTDLPKYRDGGVEIIYTITEDAVDGYTAQIEGSSVTNTLLTTSVSGKKTWDDAENQYNNRPVSIIVNLLADNVEVDEAVVTEENGWKYSFENLPVYVNGKKVTYTITEDAVAGYTPVIGGYDVTNTADSTAISGSKTWEDADNQDGKRPASITVNLLADGVEVAEAVVTAENGWKYSFDNLPKYKNGNEIVYTITEDAVAGYTAEVNGYNITNTHTPETTEISGSKIWEDANNQDGKRPARITVNLLADGVEVAEAVVTAENGWKYSFDNLPKYKNGNEIVYTITEDAVAGYTTTVTDYNIINTHTPDTTEISGSKTWEDANNQDGKRPASITVNLLADGTIVDSKTVTAENGWKYAFANLPVYANGQKITYTVTEEAVADYTASINGYDITNTYAPGKVSVNGSKIWNDNNNQDGKRPTSITVNLLADGVKVATKTVTAADGWAWSFTGLDEYAAGKKIVYTVAEDAVAGYTAEVNGYNITNTYVPGKVSVNGSKIWNDNNNQDGKRPASIIVRLYADGTEVATRVVTAAEGWAWNFEGLDEYANGQKITYTVSEDAVAGYTAEVNGYNITNTHTPAKTSVAGSKIWNDNNNQDGKRPVSITVNLLADGVKVASKTVTAADGWAWSFDNLDEYAGGKQITYVITEEAVAGYTSEVNGYNITNSYTPGNVTVSGTKSWNDANNQDGKRPASITINLLADGSKVASKTVTAADGWKYTFADLPEYQNGKKITYTVTEEAVAGYTASVNGYDITNTYATETVTVSGSKTWNDANNQDGKRPASITINLLADGAKVASKTVTAADGWAWSFEGLAKYAAGKLIDYTITEDTVKDYTVSYNGYNVTNTYVPGTTAVSGRKIWNDANDRDGLRPESITVLLLANGTIADSMTVTAADGWAWSFTDLDEYAAGEKITYTVSEVHVAGYTASISGYNITNTHIPETVNVSGTKTWNDADDQDGKRPDSIVINLLANGEVAESKTVTEADGWAWSFENLAKYEDGKLIDYTVREAAVDGYTAEYDGYNVTNTYAPEVTRIAGNKIWKDANDKDGIRPASIRINLFADGAAIDTMLVTEGDGWAWDFGYLPVYRDGGIEIAYEIREEAVAGYTAAYDGYNVINTHVADTGLTLAGKKYLNGEEAEGFSFVQVDAYGIVMDTAESAADGTFAFAPITFEEEGTYTYTVKEQIGDDEEIVYDESVYTIIVTVERDGEELNASYIVSKNGELYEGMIEFYNESLIELFEDPTPLGDAPKTGDNAVANVLIFIGFLTAGGAALKSKKRRRA